MFDILTEADAVTALGFSHPAFLLLLVVLPFVIWRWLRRRRPALRFPGAAQLQALSRGRATRARWGGALLRAIGLTLTVIALAGPRTPDLHTRIETEGIAIFLAVDVSGSMAEPDFFWRDRPMTRLEAVKSVLRIFLRGEGEGEATPGGENLPSRPSDLIGFVTFATRPETICPLTLSHDALLRMLEAEKPHGIPGESETNISDALAIGLQRLDRGETRRKILILLTDGEHNVTAPSSGWTPRQAASIAVSLGIPIYCIDAGGNAPASPTSPTAGTSELPKATREQAVASLQEIAQLTGGQYFPANDFAALLRACTSIDALEKSAITSFQYYRYFDLSQWFGLTAFGSWLLVLALEATIWRRVP